MQRGRLVVDEGEVVDRLPLVGHGHAVEVGPRAPSPSRGDVVVVAGIPVMQGDAVDQDVGVGLLPYECRRYPVGVECRLFEVVVVERGTRPTKIFVHRRGQEVTLVEVWFAGEQSHLCPLFEYDEQTPVGHEVVGTVQEMYQLQRVPRFVRCAEHRGRNLLVRVPC